MFNTPTRPQFWPASVKILAGSSAGPSQRVVLPSFFTGVFQTGAGNTVKLPKISNFTSAITSRYYQKTIIKNICLFHASPPCSSSLTRNDLFKPCSCIIVFCVIKRSLKTLKMKKHLSDKSSLYCRSFCLCPLFTRKLQSTACWYMFYIQCNSIYCPFG